MVHVAFGVLGEAVELLGVFEARADADRVVERHGGQVWSVEMVPALGRPPVWSASAGGNIAGRPVRDP